MNAHTPFDANQDWTNPYCQNSSNDPMVDALLGNAYHVVRTVYCNLGNLKLIYDFLNKYGMVLGVQSEAELKAMPTSASYVRLYGLDNTNKRVVTDYLYVDGDRTGVIPDDPSATGSWILVATSNSNDGVDGDDGKASPPYILYSYNNGSAIGGETTIPVPGGTVGVPMIVVEGYTNLVGYGFTYDASTLTVTLAQPLEPDDEVHLFLTGTPAVPDNPNVTDWVQINWLYNGGYATGGEQVIAVPYTFESVPAIYKNGDRYYAGLADKSYTVDAANQRILLTEPLATNDRLIVTIGGESATLVMSDRTDQEVARSANVKDSEVILSTNTTQYLNGKKVVYDVVAQKVYGLPVLPTNVYINTVSNGQLTYSPGNITVDLLPVSNEYTDELRHELAAETGSKLVTYKTASSGAIARSIHDRLSDYISVKDFGAVGDGSTDDTDAIKAAIVAAVAYSDRAAAVHFPGGFYNVSATIVVPSWVQLVGDGIETTQLRCLDTSVGHIVLLPNGSQFNGIRGMTVRYSTMPTSSGIGIGIKSYQPYFQQIKVVDCYIGIKIYENDYAVTSNATGVFVEQFQINDCSYVGLMVGNSNNGFCNDITFRDGLMLAGNSNHFYLGGIRVVGRVESLTLTNIDMIGGRLPYTSDAGSTEGLRFSTFTGVFFDSGAARCEFGRMRHCQFTNCWISGGRTNGTEGAIFTDAQDTSFTGLRVYNCGGHGLVFENCSYINISQASFGLNNSNNQSGSHYHMTFAANCSHFTVQNCTSRETSGTVASGVHIASGATYYTVSGNHFGGVTVPVAEGNTNAQGRCVVNNALYPTYATGSGTLASGSTSVQVGHGLAVVPQLKQIRIQQNGATVSPMYVQAVDGTYITIATAQSNASAAPFTWEADATRY